MADEDRRVLVQLVELEAAREVIGAEALEELVCAIVAEHGALLDARRGSDLTAGEFAELSHGVAPLLDRRPLLVGAVVEAERFADAAGGIAARLRL